VLPKGTITQDPARHPWACTRRCPVVRRHRGLWAVTTWAQEDRDAIRTPEAYPEAWSTSTARLAGCTRRIHSRRHRL